MKIGTRLPILMAAAALLAAASVPTRAQQQSDAAAIKIGAKDIGGVVSSPQGREAGVWVIAETTELPTQFRRIVVTDDQGRYLVPDLPQADYNVWARGYGLIDPPKMRAKPGQRLDLAAAPAPSAADAAHYYPAIYWYTLLTIPGKNEFGGENGIPANVTQQDWLTIIKNRACVGCHQLGQESTRTIPAAFSDEKTADTDLSEPRNRDHQLLYCLFRGNDKFKLFQARPQQAGHAAPASPAGAARLSYGLTENSHGHQHITRHSREKRESRGGDQSAGPWTSAFAGATTSGW